MPIRESSYGYWTSSRTFLWVAAGAAIGIGNVARVPYLAGTYGGSAFLLVYLLALLAVGWPLLVAEWAIGRWTRQDMIDGMIRLTQTASAWSAWVAIAWLALAGAVLILSYYSVIAGWSLAYIFRAAGGVFDRISDEQARQTFHALARDPERSLAWHTLFMVVSCLIVAHGVRGGIERACAYLVPAAFLLMLGILGYALARGDVAAAAAHLFRPDFSRLGWRGALEALHQAFFTLSLGVGAMFAYGGYLPAQAPLGRLALGVIALDLGFSLIAGTAVYGLALAAGQTPEPGLALLFQVVPMSLPPDWSGIIVGTLFYVVIVLVTLTSAVALMEPVTVFLIERFRFTRVFAATFTALVIWYLGLGSLLSFNVLRELEFDGRNFFEWVQWLSAQLTVPLCGFLICIFVGRILPREVAFEAWGGRRAPAFVAWRLLLSYPVRVLMIVLLTYSLGLLGMLARLWE